MNVEYNTENLRRICTGEVNARIELGDSTQNKLFVLLKLFDVVPSLKLIHNAYNNPSGKKRRFNQISIAGKQMLSLYLDSSFDVIIMPIKNNGESFKSLKFPDDLNGVESIKIMEVKRND